VTRLEVIHSVEVALIELWCELESTFARTKLNLLSAFDYPSYLLLNAIQSKSLFKPLHVLEILLQMTILKINS